VGICRLSCTVIFHPKAIGSAAVPGGRFSNLPTESNAKRWQKLHNHPTDYQHSFHDRFKDGQYLLFLRNEFGQ